MSPQRTLLAPPARSGRFLTFGLSPGANVPGIAERLGRLPAGEGQVVGVGAPLAQALGGRLDSLRVFAPIACAAGAFPSTQGALWVHLAGDDAGALVLRAQKLVGALGDDLRLDEDVASFVYGGGRDLSGYEDGTENPSGERAAEVALCAGGEPGLAGGSFVAVQRWVHDLPRLERLTPRERDHVIGRDRATNEELSDAPPSAHVKRAAQESFEPAAFMLRRSMPWGDTREHGLYFVAYGASLDPFERVLRRMAGHDDGTVDALLRFTRPVTGGYYFCPPTRDGRLDLRAVRA